jgi:DNA-directed RNA polymerase specialized sigma24 family protein
VDARAKARVIDELLLPFLSSADKTESSRLLDELIGQHALPVISQVTRAKIRGAGRQDTEDVAGEIVLQLVKKLGEIKSNPESPDFPNFKGYVAVLAYNACYKYLRDQFPDRSRLKTKLRYILTKQRNFSIWEGENQRYYCGLVAWQTPDKSAGQPESPTAFSEKAERWIRAETPNQASGQDMAQLLSLLFESTGGPLELDDAVDAVENLWRRGDRPTTANTTRPRVDDQPPIADTVERRLLLQRLWIEIGELPLDQRRALLLSLRDERGGDVIGFLSRARIASMRQIAQTLAMSPDEFSGLWNQLPLDDGAIAARLGATRQRVINLRQAARKRLARRMQR